MSLIECDWVRVNGGLVLGTRTLSSLTPQGVAVVDLGSGGAAALDFDLGPGVHVLRGIRLERDGEAFAPPGDAWLLLSSWSGSLTVESQAAGVALAERLVVVPGGLAGIDQRPVWVRWREASDAWVFSNWSV